MKADAGTKSRAPAEVVAHEADATVRLCRTAKVAATRNDSLTSYYERVNSRTSGRPTMKHKGFSRGACVSRRAYLASPLAFASIQLLGHVAQGQGAFMSEATWGDPDEQAELLNYDRGSVDALVLALSNEANYGLKSAMRREPPDFTENLVRIAA